jgi:hypothetical protein
MRLSHGSHRDAKLSGMRVLRVIHMNDVKRTNPSHYLACRAPDDILGTKQREEGHIFALRFTIPEARHLTLPRKIFSGFRAEDAGVVLELKI